MPTTLAEPTLAELIQAFKDGVAEKDRYADAHEGAVYEHFAGAAAILWTRQARRDTDMFRAIYFATSEGADLTRLLSDRYDFDRVPDAYGLGVASLRRASASGGAGTIWKGTRILVGGAVVEPRRYVVAEDKVVGATQLDAQVQVRAERPGTGTAIDTRSSGLVVRVEDPLWDSTWTVDSVVCADGTAFEPAAAARGRYRDQKFADRAGFPDALVQACRDAGASQAVFFRSDFGGDAYDVGLNMAYVGDAAFVGTDALVRAVQVKLEDVRVLGDNLQVRPLGRSDLAIAATVYLWDAPSRVNRAELQIVLAGAIRAYFEGSTSGFSYDRDALAGAMIRASSAVQYVTFTTPSSDAAVLATLGGLPNFPATLSKYRVRAEDVTLEFLQAA